MIFDFLIRKVLCVLTVYWINYVAKVINLEVHILSVTDPAIWLGQVVCLAHLYFFHDLYRNVRHTKIELNSI